MGASAPAASAAGADQKARGASATPAAPSGLKPDKLQELAKAYMAELASGSSAQDLLRRLACPTVLTTVLRGEDGILMVGDSGAELHVVGKNDRAHLINERKRNPPCILDTASGKIVSDLEGDVMCDGIMLRNCVYNPYASFSLLSISCLEHDGWTYLQGGGS